MYFEKGKISSESIIITEDMTSIFSKRSKKASPLLGNVQIISFQENIYHRTSIDHMSPAASNLYSNFVILLLGLKFFFFSKSKLIKINSSVF